jgi:hypothetical protein
MRAACRVIDLVTMIMFHERYMLRDCSLRAFLQPSPTAFSYRFEYRPQHLFSVTHSLCSAITVRGQGCHPHNARVIWFWWRRTTLCRQSCTENSYKSLKYSFVCFDICILDSRWARWKCIQNFDWKSRREEATWKNCACVEDDTKYWVRERAECRVLWTRREHPGSVEDWRFFSSRGAVGFSKVTVHRWIGEGKEIQ